MSRLIDADILDDEVMHLFISITGNPKQHTVANECKSSFRRMIEEQPTVEAVPAVHGEWIHIGGDEWCCSVCDYVISTEGSWEKPKGKFCEECGADMRKEGVI